MTKRKKIAGQACLVLGAALFFGLVSPVDSWADCTRSGNTWTCDSAGGTETDRIGTGNLPINDNITVNVNGGATISTGNLPAISLRNNANITVDGTVQNYAVNVGGGFGTGGNTIEVRSNSTINITANGEVHSHGTQGQSEAINVHGFGNKITNNGLISADHNAAIWFQDTEDQSMISNPIGSQPCAGGDCRNQVDNYGTISTGRGDNANVFGSQSPHGLEAGIKFVNHADARVIGSLSFGGGDDELTFEAGTGSVQSVTGNVNGGGGSNTLNLSGANDDYLSGYVANFQTLNKNGSGTWTITGSMTGFEDVNVNQGVLDLQGDNSAFGGKITINQSGTDPAATLRASAQTLSQHIENSGTLEIVQDQDGVYNGFIEDGAGGAGQVLKRGDGTLVLNSSQPGGNTYSNGTFIEAGALAIQNENVLGTGQVQIGGTATTGTLRFDADTSMTVDRQISTGAGGGAINTNGHNVTIARGGTNNVIGGIGSLTKNGAGTLTVDRDISHEGDTNVAQGSLILSNLGSLGNSPLSGYLNVASSAYMQADGAVNNIAGANISGNLVVNNPTFTTSKTTPAGGTGDLNVLGGHVTLNDSVNANIDGGLYIDRGIVTLNNARLTVNSDSVYGANPATISTGGRLEGIGTLAISGGSQRALNNGGVIEPGSFLNPYGTLTVQGNYRGMAGGQLIVNNVLADDGSPSSRLVIDGDSVGNNPTDVRVINHNGQGGIATSGIEFARITGSSTGSEFRLLPDYLGNSAPNGAVVGGTTLYFMDSYLAGGDRHFVLKTLLGPDGQPVLNPSIPLYEAYPAVLMRLNRLETLKQRVGNRSWLNNSSVSAGDFVEESRGAWLRFDGLLGRYKPSDSDTETSFDLDFGQVRFGLDFPLYQSDDDSVLMLGVSTHAGKGKADIKSTIGKGKIDVDSLGLGGSLTWYDSSGFYADLQYKGSWYKNDIKSRDLTASYQVKGNKGFGSTVGLELGKEWALSDCWTMIPQAQLTYSHLSFDRFYDEHNVKVNLEKGESLEGRLGVAFNYDHSDPGDIYRFQTYVLPNVYYEFLDGSEVKVAGLKYENKDDRFWGGLSLGATVDWCDAYSLYGEVTARTGLENFGDSHEFAGEAGFRLSF